VRVRDDSEFPAATRLRLSQRVGHRCSVPNCSRPTVGPVVSNVDGVHVVGRACHIEAASPMGPRYNRDMTPEQRRSIQNGIWCCNTHADIIDHDLDTFSVSTLREWKRLAELAAYERIDSSQTSVERPATLVQLSDRIVVRAVWHGMNMEKNVFEFEILDFVYGGLAALESLIGHYHEIREDQKYIVIESSGYGRLLHHAPSLQTIAGKKILSATVLNRTALANPDQAADARLLFTDSDADLDFSTEGGWIKGKAAVIQAIQLLLGSNRGQWALDPYFGSYLFRYYKDHHRDHDLLQKLIKVEISRITSIPEGGGLAGKEMVIPINAIKWVEAVTIHGHSKGLLEIDLRLYFSDDTYYSNRLSVPASIEEEPKST
jgi:hypothetical protein